MDIIKKINDLGYNVKFLRNDVVLIGNDYVKIFVRFYSNEFCIVNDNSEGATIFDLQLISLINSLLIECCCKKYERIIENDKKNLV